MKKTYDSMTMVELMEALNESVDKYNLSEDAKERVELAMDHKDIVQKYNELSLLTAYAKCMEAEQPIIALATEYYYETINVKDSAHTEVVNGVPKSSVTRGVVDGVKKFNVAKFIEWTEESNNSVAAAKTWKSAMESARKVVENQWKKFFETGKDSHSMSIGKTKKALQEMFDALVFIETPTGKNAVIANGDVAKWVLGFANVRKDSKADGAVTITGNVLPKQTWATLQLDALHKAVTGKTFDIFYGDPEVDADAKAETETEDAEK